MSIASRLKRRKRRAPARRATEPAAAPPVVDPDGYVSEPYARAQLLGGVSDSQMARLRERFGFPKPVKLGSRRNFYRRADVLAWIADRASAQGAAGGAP
jgi:predicted DNA-binding transcriptional regulator AlpA